MMMRGTRFVFAALLGAALVSLAIVPAGAQVYYLYPGAPVVSDDEAAVGGAVGFGDDLFRLVGFSRFNINPRSDLGVEVVGDVNNSNGRFGLGADFKYFIVPQDEDFPLDISAQGGFGFQSGGGVTNIDVPLGAVASRSLKTEGGKVIVPYGGLYMFIRHYNFDGAPSDTEVDLELRFGASFQIAAAGDLFLTLHIGEDVAFFAGFNATL